MADTDGPDYDRQFHALVSGLELDGIDAAHPRTLSRPAILVSRLEESMSTIHGRRARFLLSNSDPDLGVTAYGWRDGLRLVSWAGIGAAGLDEQAVVLQEDADFFSGRSEARVVAPLSRVWVEKLVVTDTDESARPDAWLENAVADPNETRVELMQRISEIDSALGRRAVVDTGASLEPDLRVISPVMNSGGELVVTVVSEADWFGWSRNTYRTGECRVRVVPIAQVWVQ